MHFSGTRQTAGKKEGGPDGAAFLPSRHREKQGRGDRNQDASSMTLSGVIASRLSTFADKPRV